MKIIIEDVETFVERMSESLDVFCEIQTEINGSYKKARYEWNDDVLTRVANRILNTQNVIRNLYMDLSDQLILANEEGRKFAEEYFKSGWDAGQINIEYDIPCISIEEDDGMKGVMYNTTAEGIKLFEDALDEYIDNTAEVVKIIKRAHEDVSNTWDSRAFRLITNNLDEFYSKMEVNIEELCEVFDEVREKRIWFEQNT